jgi:RHS repeat-associated protein
LGGQVITTGVVTTYYYLGGQLIAQNTGSTLRYVSQDNLGSTSTMSTSTGTLDSSISYYPFGVVQSGSVNTVEQFTGQILDSTGLYYYNARYYDPTIGKFISPDTMVPQPFNSQDWNRYSYCLNNPLKYTDPTGHDMIITVGGVNSDGETWYDICDGQGNLLATATGMDDLAQEITACQAESQNIHLPLSLGAADFFAATSQTSIVAPSNTTTSSTPSTPLTNSESSTPTTSSAPSPAIPNSTSPTTTNKITKAIGLLGALQVNIDEIAVGAWQMGSGVAEVAEGIATGIDQTVALTFDYPVALTEMAEGLSNISSGYGSLSFGVNNFMAAMRWKFRLPGAPDFGPTPFDSVHK